MLIPQRKEGQGRLVSRETPPQEYAVSYRLNIITNMLEHEGAEPTVAGIRSRGTVRALDGRALPLGHYDLHTDKEVIHVENNGLAWVVLM
jgi:hypothetical protein